jgi:hypothetical protein
VHDLVIVVSDLYVSQEAPERELPHGFALPGLEHAARFGSRAGVAGGWRSWLAQWLSADQQSDPVPPPPLQSARAATRIRNSLTLLPRLLQPLR